MEPGWLTSSATSSRPVSRTELFIFIFLIQRAVGGAGSVVRALEVLCVECGPGVRAVDVLVGDVVHRNGDSEHILIIISQKKRDVYTCR